MYVTVFQVARQLYLGIYLVRGRLKIYPGFFCRLIKQQQQYLDTEVLPVCILCYVFQVARQILIYLVPL